jgi:ribonuclease III
MNCINLYKKCPKKELDIILYILNPINKFITKKYIINFFKIYYDENIEKDKEKINIILSDKAMSLFQRSVTHKSYLVRDPEYDDKNKKLMEGKERGYEPLKLKDLNNIVPLQDFCYERLEFIGDAIIHAFLADYLYYRYPNEYEGFMTRLRTKIECGESLAKLCRDVGLHDFVLISRAMEIHATRFNNKSILEDAFEAFMGVIYDLFRDKHGFDICYKILKKIIESHVDIAELLAYECNYKDTLLQHFHKQHWPDPTYGLIDKSGPDHKKIFKMFVKNKSKVIGIGEGCSKKKGEQAAAKQALLNLKVIKEDDYSSSGEEVELSDDEYFED